ncbi:MAG: VWA domain-containing protein [Thermoflexales bacterium]|nr:VWA domain-containing protein [Thermoflexales bacterium]
MHDEPDYYATLKVLPDATADEIKHAYRQLARQAHPDVKAEAGTSLLFRQIQEAYEVLGDPAKRAAYDRRQADAGRSPQAVFQWRMQPSRTALPVLPDEQVLYILFDIAAGQASNRSSRIPLNVCLVLDRSTSMQGARLDQTKAAAQRMIDSLTGDDTLGIVSFSDKAEVVWPSQLLADPIKARARVSAIQASGGTEILQGLNTGLLELDKNRQKYSINHLILLTDGQTYGDEDKCLVVAVEAKRRHIGISTMGIGEDWNDTLLDALASRSGGVSQYIASTGEIQHFLRERLQGLGAVYGDNLRLTLKMTNGVRIRNAFKLSPYIQRIERDGETLILGSLQSDTPISGMLELVVGPHTAGDHRLAQAELSGDVPARQMADAVLKQDLTFAFEPEANANTTAPPSVLSALAKITIFQMQEGAWQALEKGDVANATHRLETMATRLLDMGEHQLARAALLEAGRLARSGNLSPAGRKAIKYGTRSLLLAPTKDK